MKEIERIMLDLSDDERINILDWAKHKFYKRTDDITNKPKISSELDIAPEEESEEADADQMHKTGVFYFTKSGKLVVNARKYIKEISDSAKDTDEDDSLSDFKRE